MGKAAGPLVLKGIRTGAESGVVFVFDEAGEEKVWQFAPASVAEFVALLMAGQLRSSSAVLLQTRSIDVRPSPGTGDGAEIHAGLGAADLCFEVSRADLESLRDDIDACVGPRGAAARKN